MPESSTFYAGPRQMPNLGDMDVGSHDRIITVMLHDNRAGSDRPFLSLSQKLRWLSDHLRWLSEVEAKT